jgi:hypothetical protein
MAEQAKSAEKFYFSFTENDVSLWEKTAAQKPTARYYGHQIKDFLPFIKKVMPRLSRSQNSIGLTIISVNGKPLDEKLIVAYGLEPLISSDVITKEEANRISSWYDQTGPDWHCGGIGYFQKQIRIGEITYRLTTDICDGYRNLNLLAYHPNQEVKNLKSFL